MGGCGSATGPVFQFVKTDIEQLRPPPKRFVIFAGRPVEGAPGIVGYFSHLVAPFSYALKISFTPFPPVKLGGSTLIFPRRNICHPRPASFRKSLVFNLKRRIRESSWMRPVLLILSRNALGKT